MLPGKGGGRGFLSAIIEFQPLMADVEFQPALPAFAVQGGGLVRMDLGRLEVVGPLLTWGEEEHYSPSLPPELREDDIPHLREVRFRLSSGHRKAPLASFASRREDSPRARRDWSFSRGPAPLLHRVTFRRVTR